MQKITRLFWNNLSMNYWWFFNANNTHIFGVDMSFQFVTAVWKANLSVYLKIQLKSSSSKMEIKKINGKHFITDIGLQWTCRWCYS